MEKKEFVERCKIVVELQKEGVLGVDTKNSVHLTTECFLEKFPVYETSLQNGEYPIRRTTVIDGIEFFCITTLTAADMELIAKEYGLLAAVEETGG